MPDEPLGRMITRLDGSAFSHSGLALGDGVIASAHQSFVPSEPWDLSGLRAEKFEHFWDKGQSVYRLAVPSPTARAKAVAAVHRLRLPDDGSFCVPKILIVAIALASFDRSLFDHEAGTTIRELAIDAARAWEGAPGERTFYCAEVVARAFGERFPLSALEPPGGVRPAPAPPARDGLLGSMMELYLDAATGDECQDSLDRLVDALDIEAPAFLDTVARDILASARRADDRRTLTARYAGRRTPQKGWELTGRLLPSALVTPRMLLDAPWTADTVARIDGPGAPEPLDGA
ncbi:hypothetical protein LQ327_22930 [Actinomycetospora endophytica]|uniref:Uncharacterized protein n=1 Tax=Actinomycetospora endophytica TaxID=2291215 RepID=A0ABS8PDB5_9PSEU|nr:hypothetical protein [Actinomycetospora endophytica]MCD2196233.1 hypothetical protein [Actinomycetospora endophytica]